MKQKTPFIEALKTILHSWGGDTPSEAVWGANEMLDWYEAEYNVKLGVRFNEYLSGAPYNFDEVFEAIENS